MVSSSACLSKCTPLLLLMATLYCSFSQDGTTPMYVACKNGHVDVVNILIIAGADINQTREV